MVCMKLGELYGFDNWEELWKAVELLKLLGFSDEEINEVLERSETKQKTKAGQWLRMSDLSEQEDDRYKCSHCNTPKKQNEFIYIS